MNLSLRALGIMIFVLALNVTTFECIIHCLVVDLVGPDHSDMKHVSMPAHDGMATSSDEVPLDGTFADELCHHNENGLMDEHSILDQEVRTMQSSLIETPSDSGDEMLKFYSLPDIREIYQALLERPPQHISA